MPTSAMHGLLPFGEDNTPQGPVVTWADTRADDEARRLRADPSAGDLHARTGTPLHPMSPLTKLMWTAANDPEPQLFVPLGIESTAALPP